MAQANQQWEELVSEAKPYDIPKNLIWEAYQRVKANRGAAGVDGESLEAFEKDLKGNLFRRSRTRNRTFRCLAEISRRRSAGSPCYKSRYTSLRCVPFEAKGARCAEARFFPGQIGSPRPTARNGQENRCRCYPPHL